MSNDDRKSTDTKRRFRRDDAVSEELIKDLLPDMGLDLVGQGGTTFDHKER